MPEPILNSDEQKQFEWSKNWHTQRVNYMPWTDEQKAAYLRAIDSTYDEGGFTRNPYEVMGFTPKNKNININYDNAEKTTYGGMAKKSGLVHELSHKLSYNANNELNKTDHVAPSAENALLRAKKLNRLMHPLEIGGLQNANNFVDYNANSKDARAQEKEFRKQGIYNSKDTAIDSYGHNLIEVKAKLDELRYRLNLNPEQMDIRPESVKGWRKREILPSSLDDYSDEQIAKMLNTFAYNGNNNVANYANNGGKLTKYSELSDKDRWAAIRAGVRAGYTRLDDIEKAYNEYADGGNVINRIPYNIDESQFVHRQDNAYISNNKINDLNIDYHLRHADQLKFHNPYKNDYNYENEVDYYDEILKKDIYKERDANSKKYIDDLMKSKQEGINRAIDYYKSDGFKKRAERMGEYNDGDIYTMQHYPLVNVYSKMPGKNNYDKADKKKITIVAENPDLGYEYDANPVFVGAHEYAHLNKLYNKNNIPAFLGTWTNDESPYYGNDYSGLSENVKSVLRPINAINEHDEEISENYSDLTALRALLNYYNVFDSNDYRNTFDSSLYEQIINDDRFKNNRFLKNHSKEQVIDALNLIASNIKTNNLNFT